MGFAVKQLSVGRDCQDGARLLFATADATWRSEAARVLARRADDPDLSGLPEAQGEPDTLLRTAYEVRQRAYREWQRLRGGEG